MPDSPYTSRSLALYALLQVATLIFCWSWFIALGISAFVLFSIGQIEYWLLFLAGCAGVYGLRPNLERAIDAYWLGPKLNEGALKVRADQLRPVKRRIHLIFTLVMFALLLAAIIAAYSGLLGPAAVRAGSSALVQPL